MDRRVLVVYPQSWGGVGGDVALGLREGILRQLDDSSETGSIEVRVVDNGQFFAEMDRLLEWAQDGGESSQGYVILEAFKNKPSIEVHVATFIEAAKQIKAKYPKILVLVRMENYPDDQIIFLDRTDEQNTLRFLGL